MPSVQETVKLTRPFQPEEEMEQGKSVKEEEKRDPFLVHDLRVMRRRFCYAFSSKQAN